MTLRKCELTEYQHVFYLLFKDGWKVEVGDRVLLPTLMPLQKVVSFLRGYDRDGFCTTTYSGSSSSWWANTLSQVAATEDEIAPDDLERLKSVKSAFLIEESGVISKKEGFVEICFEEIVK